MSPNETFQTCTEYRIWPPSVCTFLSNTNMPDSTPKSCRYSAAPQMGWQGQRVMNHWLKIKTFIRDSLYVMSFIHFWHAPNIDISLQSWWFSATSFRKRSLDFRSCCPRTWFHVQGCPGGLLQFSNGEAVKSFLASVSSGIHAMCPSSNKCHAWTIAERCGYAWLSISHHYSTHSGTCMWIVEVSINTNSFWYQLFLVCN